MDVPTRNPLSRWRQAQPGGRRDGLRAFGFLALFLLAVVLLTNFNIVFLGQTLVASANYPPFDDRLTHLRPEPVSGHAFGNWHDLGGTWWQWEPAGIAYSEAFRRGEVPLWDPTTAGGVDAHVSLLPTQYFPPYLPVLLLGDGPALRDLYYLGMMFGAGLAMAGLLLRNAFRPASAAAGAVAFMLCGALTQTINSNLGQATAMLPVMLLATDWLLARPTGARVGATAVVIGGSTLAGFLPIVISGCVLVALLALSHSLFPARESGERIGALRRLRPVATAAGAGALGVALAAFLLLPLALVSAASKEFHVWYDGLGRQAYPLKEAVTLLSPFLTWDMHQTQLAANKLFAEPVPPSAHLFHVGLGVLVLASQARLLDRPAYRRLLAAFAIMTGLVFAKLFGIPPVQWVAELPLFRSTHFIPYFCAALSVGVAGLAACGVESLLCRAPGRRDLLLGAAVGAATVGGVIAFAMTRGFNPAAPGAQYLRWAFELDRVVVVVAGILLVIWLRYAGLAGEKVAGIVFAGLLVLELGPIAYHGRYGRADVWRDPPEYVRFLQRQREGELFRIHGVQDLTLTPNVFQGLGLQGIGSRAVFNQSRFGALVRASFGEGTGQTFVLPARLVPKSRVVLDLLNVRYLIARAPTAAQVGELEGAGLVEVLRDGRFFVFRNPTSWPRAYLAGRYRIEEGADAALAAAATLSAPDEVILEKRPGFADVPATGAGPGSCRVAEYAAGKVTLEVDSPGPGVAVLLDAFAPGWTATVDGAPADVVPANGAFMGVEVRAGRSTVVLKYRSPGLGAGLAVSGVALGIVLVCLILPARRTLPLETPV